MCIHVSGFIPWQSMASSPTQSPQREYIPVVMIDNQNNFMNTMFSGNNLMQPVGQQQQQQQQLPQGQNLCVYHYDPAIMHQTHLSDWSDHSK